MHDARCHRKEAQLAWFSSCCPSLKFVQPWFNPLPWSGTLSPWSSEEQLIVSHRVKNVNCLIFHFFIVQILLAKVVSSEGFVLVLLALVVSACSQELAFIIFYHNRQKCLHLHFELDMN